MKIRNWAKTPSKRYTNIKIDGVLSSRCVYDRKRLGLQIEAVVGGGPKKMILSFTEEETEELRQLLNHACGGGEEQ